MKKDDDNSLIPSKLSFEDLKQVNQHGIEYWSARSLQSCLGYSQWRRFENAIQKAIESCKQSGNDRSSNFSILRGDSPLGRIDLMCSSALMIRT
ncbi:MAG TPA: hypothetical protein VLE96_00720 [Chlamydiales bacterium]|nr:hypothetical protein [Chlamydiales bacterium]